MFWVLSEPFSDRTFCRSVPTIAVFASKSLKGTGIPTYISLPFALVLNCWHLSCPIGNLQWHFPGERVIPGLSAPDATSLCPLSFSGVPPLNEMAFLSVDSNFRPTSPWPLLLPHLFLSVAFKTADLPPRETLLPGFGAYVCSGLSSGNTVSLPRSQRSSSSCHHARLVRAPVLSSAPPSHTHGSMLV